MIIYMTSDFEYSYRYSMHYIYILLFFIYVSASSKKEISCTQMNFRKSRWKMADLHNGVSDYSTSWVYESDPVIQQWVIPHMS